MVAPDWFTSLLGAGVSAVSGAELWGRIAVATFITILTLYLRRFARRGVRASLERTRVDPAVRVVIDRVVQVGILTAGASWVSDIFGVQLGTLGTLVGISGVAVGLATQDVLKQLVAGVYLMIERPFTLGDRVTLLAGSGTVRRIELLVTVIDTTGGGRVVVPNAWFLANAVTNRGPGTLVRLRLDVTIRATHPALTQAESMRTSFRECLAPCLAVMDATDVAPRVRAWVEEGAIVSLEIGTTDRDAAVDEVAWALRGRFGDDLLELREAT